MFTGIIESQAVLKAKKKFRNQIQLTFSPLGRTNRFRGGESVAVDGTCLTVTAFSGKNFSADVIPETLASTTLGRLTVGQRVNFERALRVGDSLGGHWVTGHVDATGTIQRFERRGANFRLQVGTRPAIIRRLVPKGSIAVDGISLTLQTIGKQSFTVGVTPHTFRVTTLQGKRIGDNVNLEVDLFQKLVQQFLAGKRIPSLGEKELRRQGF